MMKLTELQPKWLNDSLFIFLCPHCRKTWLSCKTRAMSHQEQIDLLEAEFGENWNIAVLSKEDVGWKITSQDFSIMTVTPSIDASRSGHWHGWIRNGQIA